MAALGRMPISIKVMDVTETTEPHLVLQTFTQDIKNKKLKLKKGTLQMFFLHQLLERGP